MTSDDRRDPGEAIDWEPDSLDGHTIDELSDYLDRGREPRDPSIEASASCQLALAALQQMRDATSALLASDSAAGGTVDESWIRGVLTGLGMESRAGRDIPFLPDDDTTTLVITEGAVRGVVRAAADGVRGVIIGTVRFEGDVTKVAEPVVVHLDVSVLAGENLPGAAARVRSAVADALDRQTDLVVGAIDVTVRDVHVPGGGSTEVRG